MTPPELSSDCLSRMRGKKNLLAFSYGVDSTALFHLLTECEIPVDIAMVNYGLRPQAAAEEEAARNLAKRFGIRIHLAHAPRWDADFEQKARRFRYAFFESLIERDGYDHLLTAHQLNDRMEWMLMRLIRGAGASELAGMSRISRRRTPLGKEYLLLRPLLDTPRHEIESYLETAGHRSFFDDSNLDPAYERSRHRPLVRSFVEKYGEGIARTFRCLERDRERLDSLWRILVSQKNLRVLHLDDTASASRAADRTLKDLGYLLTAKERARIDRGDSLVAGRVWAVERYGSLMFIAPYLPDIVMPKPFRERCRKAGIPPKIRPYLFREEITPDNLFS